MSTSSGTADSWLVDGCRRSKYDLGCAMSVSDTVAVLTSLDHKRLIDSAAQRDIAGSLKPNTDQQKVSKA